jgi:cation transport ATPase
MSERLASSNEHHVKTPEASLESKKNLEKIEAAAQHDKEKQHHQVDKIRHEIESRALSKKEQSKVESETSATWHAGDHRHSKAEGYKKTMQRVQAHLPSKSRTFSKLLHNKTVERLSEVSAVTIARPNCVLIGATFSLIGSILLLFASKRYGFEYNYFVIVVLFAIGYLTGLVWDVIVLLLAKKRMED